MLRKNKRIAVLYMLPSVLGVSMFLLIPFGYVFAKSFENFTTGSYCGIENFKIILGNKAFRLAAFNTLRFTIICIPILVTLSFLLAYLLRANRKFENNIRKSLLVPMGIPVVAVVCFCNFIIGNQGVINKILNYLGLSEILWVNSKYSFTVLIIIYLWKNIGYNVLLWHAGISNISQDIFHAAKVDGADEKRCMWYIVLPNLFPILYVIVFISLLESFKVFREAYLIAGNYPHQSTYMMQHLFNNWFLNLELDKMAVATVMLGVIFLLISGLFGRMWLKKA